MKRGKRINLVLWLAALMGVAVACHKVDPLPEPTPEPTPTDTIPTTPTDTVPTNPDDTITEWRDWVIDWDWHNQPDTNLVNQYVDDPSSRKIILNLLPDNYSAGFSPYTFNMIHRNMKKFYFSKSSNLIGTGTIFVDSGGAHLPDTTAHSPLGMASIDSIGFRELGFNVARWYPDKSK